VGCYKVGLLAALPLGVGRAYLLRMRDRALRKSPGHGRYRIELTYHKSEPSDGGKTTGNTDISAGRFLTLEPGRRIVQTAEFESSDPSFAGEMVMTWSFEPSAEGTRVTVEAREPCEVSGVS
jgi:uncharacterized protein YndB with AHSA1/START domain